MKLKNIVCAGLAAIMSPVIAASLSQPGVGPGVGTRYATDAYPGFDSEDEMIKPSRKEPRLFGWINGPKKDDADSQMAYCRELVGEQSFSKAARELDALVRQWPTAPCAAEAQRILAELQYEKLDDLDEAFAEYRYLLDFYSLQCDYDGAADRLYEVACRMHEEGKTILFFRFRNTVDVRRAYECCVLRAPGASWAATAMLSVAQLREDEGKFSEAVKVYENLRSIHAGSEEARLALYREARVRMAILREHGYNRLRCSDTIEFLKMAQGGCAQEVKEELARWLDESRGLMEEEAYLAAKFYDSKTRTVRSAINAYERFLAEHPLSARAEEVKARLEQLKANGGDK